MPERSKLNTAVLRSEDEAQVRRSLGDAFRLKRATPPTGKRVMHLLSVRLRTAYGNL